MVISDLLKFKYYNNFITNNLVLCPDGWQWESHPYKKLEFGKWELNLPPNPDGSCPIKHLSEVKVCIICIKIITLSLENYYLYLIPCVCNTSILD